MSSCTGRPPSPPSSGNGGEWASETRTHSLLGHREFSASPLSRLFFSSLCISPKSFASHPTILHRFAGSGLQRFCGSREIICGTNYQMELIITWRGHFNEGIGKNYPRRFTLRKSPTETDKTEDRSTHILFTDRE